jgi:hypothetical protein
MACSQRWTRPLADWWPTLRSWTIIAAAVLALGVTPVGARAAPPPTGGDALTELGGGSPSCRQDVGPVGRRNCRATGSVAYQHPIGNYGLDSHVSVGITHLGDAFLGALQSVAGLAWVGLVYLIKGVLLLLEWGFSIDLLDTAMSAVRRTLDVLHGRVLGQPWFLTALSVTAMWGIWRGLVQRQTTRTITGLLATVGLMVCALVVLARPNDTVGHASRLANDASLGVLAAATAQPLEHPSRSLADASQGIFDTLVRAPWCALEFGSVDYCDQHVPVPYAALCKLDLGNTQQCLAQRAKTAQLTIADWWLSAEAGSDARTSDYHALKGDTPFGIADKLGIHKDPTRVHLQEAAGTFSRFAILGLIAIGLIGAAALLAYLGIRLLLASLLSLLLLLLAPAMLLAPAFGESGRATFIAWAKRLAGAIVAKLIYALFLAIVLSAATILDGLNIGWFGTWLLQIAFWWGVLIKRHELIGFVSANSQPQHRGSGGFLNHLAQGYYAIQLGRSVKAATQRALPAPARAVRAGRTRLHDRRDQRVATDAAAAGQELDTLGRRALHAEQQRAAGAATERVQAERQLRVVDRRLSGFDENHAAAIADGRNAPLPSAEQTALLQQRRRLLDQLASSRLRSAPQVLAHAERNRAQTGDSVTDRDVAAYRERRRRDLAADLPVDHESHVRASGLDPEALRGADPPAREAMLRQVSEHVARERELLAAIPPEPAGPSGRELHADPAHARRRLAERRARAEHFTRPSSPVGKR